MKALLVIDMQEDYVGENRNTRRFPYHSEILISRINQRISDFCNESNMVIYVLNRFFYQSKKYTPQSVKGINIVSDMIFIKNRASCFTNPELIQFLHDKNVTGAEMVGIDGNYCVAASARAGVKNGLSVIFNQQCIEAAKINKLRKTISNLQNVGITIRQ